MATAVGVGYFSLVTGIPKFRADVGKMFRSGSHVTGFNVWCSDRGVLIKHSLENFRGQSLLVIQTGRHDSSIAVQCIHIPITYVMTPGSVLTGGPKNTVNTIQQAVAFLAFFDAVDRIFCSVFR